MFWDQEVSVTTATSPSYLPPLYWILETVTDRITGVTWHKLMANERAISLVLNSKAKNSWEIKAEITGKKFVWVTEQLLTLLHIQGLQQIDS